MKHDDIVAQRTTLYETAVERTVKDLAFRARLIAKPKPTLDALAEELGLDARVPDGVKIEVLDWSAQKVYLCLPPPAEASLSDTELERVAGGTILVGSAKLDSDAHGCPACPHPAVGVLVRKP